MIVLRMHFVYWMKTLIQYMYWQSDTALEMHAPLKWLKTGSHGKKKAEGIYTHSDLTPVLMAPFTFVILKFLYDAHESETHNSHIYPSLSSGFCIAFVAL